MASGSMSIGSSNRRRTTDWAPPPPARRCLGGHEDAGYGAAGNDITVYFSGRSDKGTWRAENGRICYEFTTIPSACNDVRLLGDDIYLKRSNGQVTQLLPR